MTKPKSILRAGYPRKPVNDRFWDKVQKSDGCWIWIGARMKNHGKPAYGIFTHKAKIIMAHRFSYELHTGPITNNLCVCHSCDNPPCVNPAHLWLGTKADNARDRDEKGRHSTRVGPANNKYKVTPEMRAEIVKQYSAKMQIGKIAESFKINRCTVDLIAKQAGLDSHRCKPGFGPRYKRTQELKNGAPRLRKPCKSGSGSSPPQPA